MANTDRPHGFRPLRRFGGGIISTNEYRLESTNLVIGKGDLVILQAAGVVERAAASATQICGVAAEPKDASSGGTIKVWDDPSIVFEAQTDDGTGTLTAEAGLHANANFVVADASNGISQMEIDESSGTTTSTLPLKVLNLYAAPDNEFGEFNRLECVINNHALKGLGVDGV